MAKIILNYSSHLNITFRGQEEYENEELPEDWNELTEWAQAEWLYEVFVQEWINNHIEVWVDVVDE